MDVLPYKNLVVNKLECGRDDISPYSHLRYASRWPWTCWILLLRQHMWFQFWSSLTITVVKLRRPPDHAVRLPVPHALHHLVHQHLPPGGHLVWTGVHYGVTQLPLLVRPGNVHPHVGCWNRQPTASGWIPIQIREVFKLDTYGHTGVGFWETISCWGIPFQDRAIYHSPTCSHFCTYTWSPPHRTLFQSLHPREPAAVVWDRASLDESMRDWNL